MRYIFISTERSGHHAIMLWFIAQHRRDYTHYNNCKIDNDCVTSSSGRLCGCCNFSKTIKKHKTNNSNLVFNFESKPLEFVKQCEKLVPLKLPTKNLKIRKFIVLRDHYNVIASYITKWSIERLKKLCVIERWKEYAYKILDIQSVVSDEYDYILFNKWCNDKKYRNDICNRYNLQFTDAHFKTVPDHGNGSSFRRQNKKEKRDYNNRYKLLLENKEYLKIVADPELVELSEKIFNNFRPINN